MKLDFWPLLLYRPQRGAVVYQQRWGIHRVERHAVRVGVHEFFQLVGVVTRYPAGQVEVAGHDARPDTVFMLQPVRYHLKLQLPHSTKQQQRARNRPEHLNRAFFAQLGQAGAQLLGSQRISYLYGAEHFGCKKRQAGKLQCFAFGQRVTQLQHAVVGNADDVACKSGVEQFAPLAHEAHHRVGAQLFAAAHHLQSHAARELATGHPQKRNPVAVGRVHIGLDLEDHT